MSSLDDFKIMPYITSDNINSFLKGELLFFTRDYKARKKMNNKISILECVKANDWAIFLGFTRNCEAKNLWHIWVLTKYGILYSEEFNPVYSLDDFLRRDI